MSNEQERKELLKKAEDAWAELAHHTYEVVAPRFYREKKGRKMEPTHPWLNITERITTEERTHELYEEWLHLYQRYIAMTGERPPLPFLYKEVETPSGLRYVRR